MEKNFEKRVKEATEAAKEAKEAAREATSLFARFRKSIGYGGKRRTRTKRRK